VQVNSLLDSQIGLTLFDLWLDSVQKRRRCHRTGHGGGGDGIESPLIDAAFQAFNAYVRTVETMNNAQIAALAPQVLGYTSNGQSATPITTQDIAPFLALNIMA
jgi:hypothetical protein